MAKRKAYGRRRKRTRAYNRGNNKIMRVVDTQQMTKQYNPQVFKVNTIEQTRLITDVDPGGFPLDLPYSFDIWYLANLPQYSSWNAIYNQYRIIGAKITLIPFHKYNYNVIHSEIAGMMDREHWYSFGTEKTFSQILECSNKVLAHTNDLITLTYKPRGKNDPQKEFRSLIDAGTSSSDPFQASFNFRTNTNLTDDNIYYTVVLERCILFRGIK